MKCLFRLLPLIPACVLPLTATAQTFQEGFESYSALFQGSNPWAIQNTSDSAAGGTPWFAGDTTILPAQSGTGYVAANFLSTGGIAGTERISNWLISPIVSLTNGATVSFFTLSAGGAPDRLELRLSLAGASTNVGTTSSDVGDFTTLLLTINPTLAPAVYPSAAYTQFTGIIAGVPVGGAVGRVAFHYDVTNSGTAGVNGDYIGVDNLTSNLTLVPEPSTYVLCLGGLVVGGWLVARRRREQAVA